MKETRKQIINLIEPYMDKTLTFGCLIKSAKIKEKSYFYDTGFITAIVYGQENNIFECHEVRFEENIDEYKILGHYDITAVEKFIRNKGGEITHFCDKYIYINIYGENNETICIPNKPLILYSEQEQKQILDLLIKLK